MALRMKPIPPNPDMERKLKEAAEAFDRLSPEEQEAMLRAQQKSWTRQDMD